MEVKKMRGEFGKTLKDWRKKQGLTQEGLAKALNVKLETVNRWENGKSMPSPIRMEKLRGLGFDDSAILEKDKPADDKEALRKRLGLKIRRWRARLGVTQTELARKLETSVGIVSRWETGNIIPSLYSLEALKRLGFSENGEE
jgi:transcriptional regulator with XRE-family HTH domain